MLRSLRLVLADLARLRLPVTAAATLATVLALLAPFGLQVGDELSGQITGAIAAFGLVVTWLQRYVGAGGGFDHTPAGEVTPDTLDHLEPTS